MSGNRSTVEMDIEYLKQGVNRLDSEMSLVRDRSIKTDQQLKDHIHHCLRQFEVIHNDVKDNSLKQTIVLEQTKQLAELTKQQSEKIETNYAALMNIKQDQTKSKVYWSILGLIGTGCIGFLFTIAHDIVKALGKF